VCVTGHDLGDDGPFIGSEGLVAGAPRGELISQAAHGLFSSMAIGESWFERLF
jgi:hypothetical protein